MKALKKFRLIVMGAVVLTGLSLSACQNVTPADRISANPAMFSALPAEQQTLVRQGRISTGMTPDAVMLAWGKPNAPVYRAQKNGKNITRWYYEGYTPVTVFNDGPYPFWGPYGMWDSYTSTAFIPHNAAVVEFIDGKVTQWEKNDSE